MAQPSLPRTLAPPRSPHLAWLAFATALAAVAVAVALAPDAAAQCTPGPPANDCHYQGFGVAALPYSNFQSSAGATTEGGEPQPCCSLGNTVWYGFTATAAGTVNVSTCGSNYDTTLAAFSGTGALSTLAFVTVNDDSCGLQSNISFTCVAGTTYWIQIGDYAGGPAGNLQIDMSSSNGCAVTTPPAPPPPPPPPPPGCGYSINPAATYDFVDLTGIGTGVSLSDDSSTAVTPSPGFSFNFCGNTYSTFTLSSNGYICLGSMSCTTYAYSGSPSMPSSSGNPPRPAILGYFTDLYPPGCTGGSTTCARWDVQGTAPNRVFIYMQKETPYCCSTSPQPVTYEIKLFETTNCIEVHFQSVSDPAGFRHSISGYQFSSAWYTYADQQNPGFNRAAQAWSACPQPPVQPDTQTVLEDAPTVSIPVLANDPSGFTVVAVSGATLGTATVTPGGTGIDYTPLPDANGVDAFTYTAQSGSLNVNASVTVTITPVNDAPAFAIGPPLEAAQQAAAQQVPGWATAVVEAGPITASPPRALDEAGQNLTFELTLNSNPAIFTGIPQLVRGATATATTPSPGAGDYAYIEFTPAPNTYGASDLCFRVRDDGGTANGGIDVSAPQCAVVTVAPCTTLDDTFVAYAWWTLRAPDAGNLGVDPVDGILANDLVAPGQPVQLVDGPLNGVVTLEEDGYFTYRPFDGYPAAGLVGTDSFTYTATCGQSESRVTTVDLVVRHNEPPVAAFTYDTDRAGPRLGIPFMDASTDADGWIVQWEWEFGDGGVSQERFPVHAFDSPGDYEVRLTVRDNVGNTSETIQPVHVRWTEPPAADEGHEGLAAPVAEAGPDRIVVQGATVTLQGSQTGGGAGVRWHWMQAAGDPVELRNADSPFAEFTAPDVPDGETRALVFGLHVTEGSLVGARDYTTIRVIPANHAPHAVADAPREAEVGQRVTLDGTGSTDPEGGTLAYTWERVAGPEVVLEGAETASATFEATEPGLLRLRLRVTDGSLVAQDDVTVEVLPRPVLASGFTYAMRSTAEGTEVVFRSEGGEAAEWDFDDGSPPATGAEVSHVYRPGVYHVTMRVGDQSTSQVVDVDGPQALGRSVADEGGFPWLVLLGVLAIVAAAGAALLAVVRLRRLR